MIVGCGLSGCVFGHQSEGLIVGDAYRKSTGVRSEPTALSAREGHEAKRRQPECDHMARRADSLPNHLRLQPSHGYNLTPAEPTGPSPPAEAAAR